MVIYNAYYKPLIVIFVLVIGTVLWSGYLRSRRNTLIENHCALVRGKPETISRARIVMLDSEAVHGRFSHTLYTIELAGVGDDTTFSFRLERESNNGFLNPDYDYYDLTALYGRLAALGVGAEVDVGTVYNRLVYPSKILSSIDGESDFGRCKRLDLFLLWPPALLLMLWTLLFGGMAILILTGRTRVATPDQLAKEKLDKWDGWVP